jgi:hypothetical protein
MQPPKTQKIVSTGEATSTEDELVYTGVDNVQNRHMRYPFKTNTYDFNNNKEFTHDNTSLVLSNLFD